MVINYIKLLDFAGEEVFDTDCMPLRLILMDCIEKLSPGEQKEYVYISDIYKALQESEVDRSAIDAELKAMVDSREIMIRDGKVKLLVTWLDLVKMSFQSITIMIILNFSKKKKSVNFGFFV